MVKKIVFSIAFAFLLMINGFAQKAKITGKVLSSKTGESLIGATITIEGKNKSTKSDQNGNFSISGLEKGTYTIICTYVSYEKKIDFKYKFKRRRSC